MSLSVFHRGLIKVSAPASIRAFSSSSIRSNTAIAAAQKQRAKSREQHKKDEQKRTARLRVKARVPADMSPFYYDLPTALRYLRAAEVGRSAKEAVISVSVPIIADRGAPALSGSVTLPKPLKETRSIFFSTIPEQLEAAKASGITIAGGSELIEQIKEGTLELDYDRAYATADILKELAPIARTLGPKGLMPTPKKGTVVTDIATTLSEVQGSTPFRQRKSDQLAIAVGRCNFSDREILANIVAVSNAFKEAIAQQKTKRSTVMGKVTITSTHGPGLVIDF